MEEQSRRDQIRQLMFSFYENLCARTMASIPEKSAPSESIDFEEWFINLADRALKSQSSQAPVKLATHIVKGVHQKAEGSFIRFSLAKPGKHLNTIGTHSLGMDYEEDVIGNAAYKLKEFKIAQLLFENRRLIDLMKEKDADVLFAINKDSDIANDIVEKLLSILSQTLESSTLVKQIYWMTGDTAEDDSHYHLLSPLYPTSLVHKVYQTIQEDRFGDEPKAARQARRDGKSSETGYRDYPNLAVKKLGGTKPLNISQLNSERGGNNYLLASLPPQWESSPVNAPMHTDSVFPGFGRRRETRWLAQALIHFLKTEPPRNMETRNKVDAIVDALIEELVMFAARFQMLEPGWSADTNCQLVEAEALWLDRMRAETDDDFKAKYEQMDWPGEIKDRFARWINHQLRALPVGDDEHAYWAGKIHQRLNAFQEVVYG